MEWMKNKMNKAKDLADNLKGKNWENALEDKKSKRKGQDNKKKYSLEWGKIRILDFIE